MTERLTVEVDSELKDLIPNFLANRNKELGELGRALERADFEAMRIIGHNMKGVGGGYGFDHITELGVQIETAAKVKDDDKIRDCLGSYQNYLQHIDVVFV